MDGGGLDLLRPGERVRSWEGSPFLLHLAAIAKPASLGVLPSSATPARIEVARHEAGWTVTHAGGGWSAPQRTALPRGAEDTDALLHAALWGAGQDEPTHPFAVAARHVRRVWKRCCCTSSSWSVLSERRCAFGGAFASWRRRTSRWPASTSADASVIAITPYSPYTLSSPWASSCRTMPRHCAAGRSLPMP